MASLITVVGTVRLPATGNIDTDAAAQEKLREAVVDLIAAHGGVLVPCGWAPDEDTIADAAGVEYGDIEVFDLNPPRPR